MKFNVLKTPKSIRELDLLASLIFKPASTNPATFALPEHITNVDKSCSGQLLKPLEEEGFVGDEGSSYITNSLGNSKAKAIAFIGLGDTKHETKDLFRRAAGEVCKLAHKKRAAKIALWLPKTHLALFDVIAAIAEGIYLANYRFNRYDTKDKKIVYLQEIDIIIDEDIKPEFQIALQQAKDLTDGICLARDLINEGPMVLNPVKFAEQAEKVAKDTGLSIDILDEHRLKKEKMGLMLAVASAAQPFAPPRLIRLHYCPKNSAQRKIVLLGKGVTFDCGGLDIKTAEGMLEMKIDMSGAAAVLGVMQVIAKLEPEVEVIGYMACVENGIGSHAFHPGDIVVSHKGISVEINNTDAEGRLILADAMSYATERDAPDTIIDIATLTGAIVIALGTKMAGLFCRDDVLSEAIINAGLSAGEAYWRMPLNKELRENLKSPVADIKNSGDRWGSSITATLFIEEFLKEGITWAHLDIAGPASNHKPHPYLSNGGVGFGVSTLVSLLMSM